MTGASFYELFLTYKDPDPVVIFVSDGISNGSTWGTYYRKSNGSLKRLQRSALPLRNFQHQAQDDLDAFATEHALMPYGKGEEETPGQDSEAPADLVAAGEPPTSEEPAASPGSSAPASEMDRALEVLYRQLQKADEEYFEIKRERSLAMADFTARIKANDEKRSGILSQIHGEERLASDPSVLPFQGTNAPAPEPESEPQKKDCICGHPAAAHFDEQGEERPCAVQGCECGEWTGYEEQLEQEAEDA